MENENLPATRESAVLAPIDPERIITLAIERGVDVNTMERLLTMRRELRAENAKAAFDAALSAFQSQCPIIAKTKSVMNKDGKTVRYSYAPLESIVDQVRERLATCGLSYQFTTTFDAASVTTTCHVRHIAGHSEFSSVTVPVDTEGYMSAPQKTASAITFASRYAFRNAFGILTGDDDDDAQSVTPPPQPKAQAQPQPKTPPPEKTEWGRANAALHASHPHDLIHTHAVKLGLASAKDLTVEQIGKLHAHLDAQANGNPRPCTACGIAKNGDSSHVDEPGDTGLPLEAETATTGQETPNADYSALVAEYAGHNPSELSNAIQELLQELPDEARLNAESVAGGAWRELNPEGQRLYVAVLHKANYPEG